MVNVGNIISNLEEICFADRTSEKPKLEVKKQKIQQETAHARQNY